MLACGTALYLILTIAGMIAASAQEQEMAGRA
jgi:hypothetical protein